MSSIQLTAFVSKSGNRCFALDDIPNNFVLAVVITSVHFCCTSLSGTRLSSFCLRSNSSNSAFKCSVLALLSSYSGIRSDVTEDRLRLVEIVVDLTSSV